MAALDGANEPEPAVANDDDATLVTFTEVEGANEAEPIDGGEYDLVFVVL